MSPKHFAQFAESIIGQGPCVELWLNCGNHPGKTVEVLVVQTKPAQQIPNPLNGIELRRVDTMWAESPKRIGDKKGVLEQP